MALLCVSLVRAARGLRPSMSGKRNCYDNSADRLNSIFAIASGYSRKSTLPLSR